MPFDENLNAPPPEKLETPPWAGSPPRAGDPTRGVGVAPLHPEGVAPLHNVILFSELLERVLTRAPGLPGLATFHGPSGYGKSRAALWGATRYRAIYVQIKSLWTRKSLGLAILNAMGLGRPAANLSEIFDPIAEHLALSRRPLILDEADSLLAKGMIEMVRDLHESTQAPIVLIGEEGLPVRLKAFERVHGRMLDWVAAQPASFEDACKLAKIYAEGVSISSDLLQALQAASAGSARRVCVNLDRVREAAQTADRAEIDLAGWRAVGGGFFTGALPALRRGF